MAEATINAKLQEHLIAGESASAVLHSVCVAIVAHSVDLQWLPIISSVIHFMPYSTAVWRSEKTPYNQLYGRRKGQCGASQLSVRGYTYF